MSKNGKKPEDGRPLTDAEADSLLREMMLEEGWLAPETEEGVARAEAAMGDVELPPSLLDPFAVLDGKPRAGRQAQPTGQVVENLAAAARNGGDVPEDVKERMRRDREAAEGEADGA